MAYGILGHKADNALAEHANKTDRIQDGASYLRGPPNNERTDA